MNGNLRRHGFVMIDGKRYNLRELDIKNSQPYFLIALYNEMAPQDQQWYYDRNNFIDAVTSTTSGNSFYEILHKGPFETDAKRQEYKKDVLTALYDKTYRCEMMPIWQDIKENFPLLAASIVEIKKDNYRNLARKLQRLESDVMIKRVVTQFARNRPNFFLLPTHDGVIFIDTPENEKLLREMIIEECIKKTNVAPVLTSKKVEPQAIWTFKDKTRVDNYNYEQKPIKAVSA